jgi:hypothetical protein
MDITPERYRVIQGDVPLCVIESFSHNRIRGRDYYFIWPDRRFVPDWNFPLTLELPEGNVSVMFGDMKVFASNAGELGDFYFTFIGTKENKEG